MAYIIERIGPWETCFDSEVVYDDGTVVTIKGNNKETYYRLRGLLYDYSMKYEGPLKEE